MKLTLDIETFSRINLKSAGLYAYAEDESTDLLCVCWAVDDGPVHAWIPDADPELCLGLQNEGLCLGRGREAPIFLVDYIKSGGIIHAWNAAFERQVLNGPAGKRYGFPQYQSNRPAAAWRAPARRPCPAGSRTRLMFFKRLLKSVWRALTPCAICANREQTVRGLRSWRNANGFCSSYHTVLMTCGQNVVLTQFCPKCHRKNFVCTISISELMTEAYGSILKPSPTSST